ncbi:MAG: type II toxin-antitoxin system VapB family antitoxin [Chitinispirillaceae bacterium]|jgi:Arc/MetJ family transcription regulator
MRRTNIVLDEKLVEKGKKATGLKTSKAVVDFALKQLIRHSNQRRILDLFGSIDWEGDLSQMRTMRGNS